MLRDVEFFKDRIAKIEGGEAIGEDLVKTVREKVVKVEGTADQINGNGDANKDEK